jgi:hypothetical protein
MPTPARHAVAATVQFGRGSLGHLLAAALLVLQVFVVGVVPVLDATTDHVERVVVHVEDAQQGDCPASHDSEDCRLCQVLSAMRGMPTEGGSMPVPMAARAFPQPVDAEDRVPSLVFLAGNSSRAPPRA